MSDLFSIDDKIIVVSGATGVLGSAMTAYLAEQRAKVVALGRNPDKINALIAEIKGNRHKVFPLIADVTNERDLERAKLELEHEYGKIDVLVNLAGGNMAGAVITPEQTILDARIDELNKVMELNYMGSFLPIKTFLPLFLKDLKGSIINISSMAAQRPITRVLGYGSA
ncbi:MAG: SDR family NAD(P)-dependent oxidoreductase, partial [Eudoraea sp.]|uniref:SDR family NAD(P)-dependent oxidoreductase n=1 Tax=Eudoraea sp. TaxID=1979955 RepID=UPI003C713BC4